MSEATRAGIHVRWCIQRDLPEVLAIERASFALPWSEADFRHQLKQGDCIGVVAECGGAVVGYCLYELRRRRFELLNFAVDPARRRRGVGAALVGRLARKLPGSRRNAVGVFVRESDLPAQLFFRFCGFRAVGVCRNYYGEGTDAYRMSYLLSPEAAESPPY